MNYKLLTFVIVLTIGTILTSCEKKVLEGFLVYERTEISIPNVVEVKSVSFPTIKIGYAITDKGTFKTIDGGSSWSNIETYSVGNISFFDESYGIISTGYATTDGGETWNILSSSKSVSITEDGRIVVLKKDSWNTGSLWLSDYKDLNLQFKYSINYVMSDLDRIECHGEHIYIFPKNLIDDHLVAYNHNDGLKFQIEEQYTADEAITDLCVFENSISMCGGDGFIGTATVPLSSNFGYVSRTYYSHTNPFVSIDNYKDLVVAVGTKAIATNKKFLNDDSDFKDVYQPSLDSFDEDFILVNVIDENNIITVTSNAKIYIGKI